MFLKPCAACLVLALPVTGFDVVRKVARSTVGKTIGVETHNESLSTLVVGFHTSWLPKYTRMLKSQLDTWAADIPASRILVSGGSRDTVGATTACRDDRDQTCKDAAILFAAARKTAETGAYWFLGVHEDAYVQLDVLTRGLSKLPTKGVHVERPVMLAGIGCGRGWQYHPDNHGTNAKPSSWVEPVFTCQSVWQQGGLCTGPAYLINRPALMKLTNGYDQFQDFFKEYMTHFHGEESHKLTSSDRLMGCVFRAKEIDMVAMPQYLYWDDVMDISQGWENRTDTPSMIRAHSILNIIGPPGLENVASAIGSNRERIPTFMREAHRYIGRAHHD